jgi:cysteine-rich repeat protein
MFRGLSAVWVVAAGCVSAGDVPCGDGQFCAEGTVCAAISAPTPAGEPELRCVRSEQVQACVEQSAFMPCTTSDIGDGRCYDGVCLPAGCGNGRVDPDEVCDDANAASGDGCSAACQSDESCGNGIVDPLEQCDDGNAIAHDGCSRTCRAEASRWTKIFLGTPSGRSGHTLVYASRRGRAVLFGGAPRAILPVDDVWEWDGRGWRLFRPTFRPPSRLEHASAYDPERDRVVVFGGAVIAAGVEASVFNDTWEWDGERWEVKSPAVRPDPRTGAAMAFDPRTKVIVMFGGSRNIVGESVFLPDLSTWEWDGSTWKQYTQLKPPDAQEGHVMAFDPHRNALVMVGNKTVQIDGMSAVVTAVWEYENHEWVERSFPLDDGPVPEPRANAAMAFDPARGTHGELVMFSGRGLASGRQPEAWSWDGTRWSYIADTGLGVENLGVAYDPVHGLIGYGGLIGSGILEQTSEKTHAWQNGTWVELVVGSPSERRGHVAAVEPLEARMITAGNQTAITTAWQLSGEAWRALPGAAPALPELSAMAVEPAGRGLVVFGGDTTWTLAGDAWSTHGGNAPPSRTRHAMSTAKDHVVLFGGKSASGVRDDTWIWQGGAWTEKLPPTAPSRRAGHVMAYDPIRGVVVLFGGNGAQAERYDDTWEWDGTSWTHRELVTRPTARAHAAMAWDPARKRLVLFGGENSAATKLDDAWEYDGIAWTRVETPLVPEARSMHTLVPSLDGRGVLLFGGRQSAIDSDLGMNDLWRLRWESSESDDTCSGTADGDGDGALGCDDAECWATCAPLCPPGVSCAADAPRCGDGACSAVEDCRSCSDDCGVCTAVCGDLVCDPSETCPGDCF